MAVGFVLYLALQRHLLRGIDGPPVIRGLEGRRMFERTMVFLSWRLARTLEGLFGTRRLQPQLRLVVCVAIFAVALTVYIRVPGPGNLTPSDIDPVLALVPIDRRATLIAGRSNCNAGTIYRFDIYLQGDNETVFFDV